MADDEQYGDPEFEDYGVARERTPPRTFLRQVRTELRKVAWPNRKEVASYTTVVLVATVVLSAIVFGLDSVFRNLVIQLFG